MEIEIHSIQMKERPLARNITDIVLKYQETASKDVRYFEQVVDNPVTTEKLAIALYRISQMLLSP